MFLRECIGAGLWLIVLWLYATRPVIAAILVLIALLVVGELLWALGLSGARAPTPPEHAAPAGANALERKIITCFYPGLGGSWLQALRYAGDAGVHGARADGAPKLLYGLQPVDPPEVTTSLWQQPASGPWLPTLFLTHIGQRLHGIIGGEAYWINVPRVSFAQHDDIQQFLARVRAAWKTNDTHFMVLAGTSRGASTVLSAVNHMTREEQKRLAGNGLVILEGVFDSVPAVAASRYGAWFGGVLLPWILTWVTRYDSAALTPLELARHFTPHVPVAVITSKVDWQVPMANSLRVRDAIVAARGGDATAVHTLVLETSGHSYYATGNLEDQKRYFDFIHRLYTQYVHCIV